MKTGDVKKRFTAGRLILIGGVILIVIVLAVASVQLLSTTRGWSKDVAVTNEMATEILSRAPMTMRIQFKTDPNPPVAGTATLMARIKDEVGYTARVNQVLFTYKEASQGFTQTKEGVAIGKFGTQGEGIYTASAELPFPGDWQLNIEVNHAGSRFNAAFPFEVKAQQ